MSNPKSLKDMTRGKELSTGGAWTHSIWYPGDTADDDARKKAEEYGNILVTENVIRGIVDEVVAFKGKKVFVLRDDDGEMCMLQDWASLKSEIERQSLVGMAVEIEYNGKEKVKSGKHAGKMAHVCTFYALEG